MSKIIPISKFEDVLLLQSAGAREGRHLEFKRDLPGTKPEDKKRFLYGIAAMVNAGGGQIIYGIEEKRAGNEKTGEIDSIPGLTVAAPDSEKAKLIQLIRTGIEPVIVDVSVDSIHSDDGNRFVMLVTIPESQRAPHMVTLQSTNKFYNRNSHGKFLMDVDEIRAAFINRANGLDLASSWLRKRMELLTNRQYPLCALHLVPLSAFMLSKVFDVRAIKAQEERLKPINVKNPDSRFNTDGFISYETNQSLPFANYIQFFRSGQIESVSRLFHSETDLHPIEFELELRARTSNYLEALRHLNITAPILVSFSMSKCQGFKFKIPQNQKWLSWYLQDRGGADRIIMDHYFIAYGNQVDSWDTLDVDRILKPICDTIWNAAGWPASPNFDNEGNWKPNW